MKGLPSKFLKQLLCNGPGQVFFFDSCIFKSSWYSKVQLDWGQIDLYDARGGHLLKGQCLLQVAVQLIVVMMMLEELEEAEGGNKE